MQGQAPLQGNTSCGTWASTAPAVRPSLLCLCSYLQPPTPLPSMAAAGRTIKGRGEWVTAHMIAREKHGDGRPVLRTPRGLLGS